MPQVANMSDTRASGADEWFVILMIAENHITLIIGKKGLLIRGGTADRTHNSHDPRNDRTIAYAHLVCLNALQLRA